MHCVHIFATFGAICVLFVMDLRNVCCDCNACMRAISHVMYGLCATYVHNVCINANLACMHATSCVLHVIMRCMHVIHVMYAMCLHMHATSHVMHVMHVLRACHACSQCNAWWVAWSIM